MFRLFIVLLLLACGLRVVAGPDDDFLTIYNLIQATDGQRAAGRLPEARQGYLTAQRLLRDLQRAYPAWNERVITYRMRYVAEKLAALPEAAAATAPQPGPAAEAPPAPAGEVIEQFNQLNSQISRLTAEKQQLEARLREALTAQPAPLDPKELEAAVEQIAQLQSTNRVLLADLERQRAERKNLVDKVVAEEARAALDQANRELAAQRDHAAELERQKADVEGRFRKLSVEYTAWKTQAGTAADDPGPGGKLTELADQLARVAADLDATRKRNEELAADRSRLEEQVGELQSMLGEEAVQRMKQLQTDLAFARAEAGRHGAIADELAVQLAGEKDQRLKLGAENQELRQRVQSLTDQAGELKGVEAQLAAEKKERAELEAQLRAAEERVDALRQANPDIVSPAPTNATLSGQLWLVETEAGRLRDALKDSRAREAELATLLTEADTARVRLEREKLDLIRRLQAAEAGIVRRETPEHLRLIAELEEQVRQLEEERDALAARLAQNSTGTSQVGDYYRRQRLGNPKMDAARFRLTR